ncbi:hypothetical protein HK107_12875 [Parvularcula sp. ZS-1/3]|uniref:Uncharacterized protein n=1 Tax=Parvularcula mediterranea TaxID=2732508 RepID=A0A7Y3RN93_9PROT|nr:hypothetical protein [Parvularcula mediterranea]NNU17218.1 hypothetical protein [Parvularcula mediterranea]
MTDSPEMPASPIPVGVAKAIALGLGLLLLGGTAVLITLLVTRPAVTQQSDISAIELQVGEKVSHVSHSDGKALFLIEGPEGEQRVLLLNLATGARTEIPVLAALTDM